MSETGDEQSLKTGDGEPPRKSEAARRAPARGAAEVPAEVPARVPAKVPAAGESFRPLYGLIRIFMRVTARPYFRAEVKGLENVPATGPFLLLSNHASILDPPTIGYLISREIRYLARDSLFNIPVFGFLMRRVLNTHPIRRGGVDRTAILTCAEILRAGWGLLLFPEGTRTRDGKVAQPRGGFGMILDEVPLVPCVPVYLEGTFRAMGRGTIVPRPSKLRVSFGEAFIMEPRAEGESRRDFFRRCADRLDHAWRDLGAYENP